MTAKRLLSRAIELVLEDWPEDHPEVETFLKEAREFVASSGEADCGVCKYCGINIRKTPTACDNCPASTDKEESK